MYVKKKYTTKAKEKLGAWSHFRIIKSDSQDSEIQEFVIS